MPFFVSSLECFVTLHFAAAEGNIRPQSSQLAEPLWTDPGLKSGISVRKLISTLKEKEKKKKEKKKKVQAGNEWKNILPKFSQAWNKPPPFCCPTVELEFLLLY